MSLSLTNSEIVSRFKTIADFHVKADSGTTTTAVVSKLVDEEDLTGYYACFVSGDNYGLDRIIDDFDDTSGTMTFTSVTNAVDNVSEICLLEKGFQSDAKQADLYLENYLRNKGYDVSLFLTSSQLKEAHLYKTLELICSERMNEATESDVYYANKEKFRLQFEAEMNKLVADYDDNESGSIDSDEELFNTGQVRFSR